MNTAYQSCIDACTNCATACDHCTSSCLQEEDVTMMARCIQLDMECSNICKTTAVFMHLQSNHANTICQICADVCTACAVECEKHDNEHCRKCASACRECAEECLSMVAA